MLLVGVLVILAILSALLFASWKSKCLLPVVVAVTLQISLASIILNTIGFQGDAGGYFAFATEIHDRWSRGQMASNPYDLGRMSILWLIAGLYLLTGPNVALALILLCTLMAFVPLLVCLATREFGFKRASTFAAWLGALSPPVLLWGSWIQRESITFPILALALWGISRVYRGATLAGVGIASCSVGLLVISRPQLIVPVTAGLIAAQILSSRNQSKRHVRNTVGVFLVATAMMLAFLWSPSSETVVNTERRQLEMAYNAQPINNTAVAPINNSPLTISFALPLSSPAAIDIPIEVVSRLPLATFGPFPSDWKDRSWTMIGLDGLAWLLLTLGAIYLVIRHRNTRRMTAICSAMAIVIFLGLALTLANYGLAMRVRAHAWITMIPIAAVLVTQVIDGLKSGLWKIIRANRSSVSRPAMQALQGVTNADPKAQT